MSILEWGFINELNETVEEEGFNEQYYIHNKRNKIYSGSAFFTVLDKYRETKDIPLKFTFELSTQIFTYISFNITHPKIQNKLGYKFKNITFKNFYDLVGISINQNISNNHFHLVNIKRFKL